MLARVVGTGGGSGRCGPSLTSFWMKNAEKTFFSEGLLKKFSFFIFSFNCPLLRGGGEKEKERVN